MKKTFLLLLSCAIISNAFSQKGNWQLVKSVNKTDSRSECGLAALNGKLYLIGGDGPALPVEQYDPATRLWTKKAVAPIVMHHFEAATLGNMVYVLDCFYEGGFPNQTPAPNAYVYNTDTDNWVKLNGLPETRRRGGAGAAAYNGKLYLVCGITHGHASGTDAMFDCYDPKTETWTALPDAPHVRDHCQAAVINDKLYAIGGRNTSLHDADNFMSFFDKVVLDVDVYDFKTNTWSTLDARLPQGTGGGTAANLNGKLFYIGGERATATTPNSAQKDVYYYDTVNGKTWNKAASLNTARNGVGGAVVGEHIYIAGGVGGGPGGPPPNGRPGLLQGTMSPPPNGGMPQGPPPNNRPQGYDNGIALEVFSWK